MLLVYYIQTVEILEQLVESGSETMDVRNKDEVVFRMRAAVASKQFGQEEIICSLVADVSVIELLIMLTVPQGDLLVFFFFFNRLAFKSAQKIQQTSM